jgi:hypothetical protein
LEQLESRQLMTVYNHGGLIMPNVEVQSLYYGADWYNNPTLYSLTGNLDGFANNVVHSSYMDMLTKAGYGVGRGSFDAGTIALANLTSGNFIPDSWVRSTLQDFVTRGFLKSPDSNRLYIVYVEPNVGVVDPTGHNSHNDFAGYHTAFAGTDAAGNPVSIRYAIIAYPGGATGNTRNNPFLSDYGSVTLTASHELAEAVTDPDVNYGQLAWYDDARGEVGDIANAMTVLLNGYAVQRISDQFDQPMTPAGATALYQESFVLRANGDLWRHNSAGWTLLASGVAKLSDQGIDPSGLSMVDFVTTDGRAFEYHDGLGTLFLTAGVRSAKAGQGVSYILLTNGDLYEFDDTTGATTRLDYGDVFIDAGTDQYGVNTVDVIDGSGGAWERSDTTGWHYLGSGVRWVSAGQQGYSELVLTTNDAYHYDESSGNFTFLASNVAGVTAGVDERGNLMIDLQYLNGDAWEFRSGSGWQFLDSGVFVLDKARAGIVDVVHTDGTAYEHDSGGWRYLTDNAIFAS